MDPVTTLSATIDPQRALLMMTHVKLGDFIVLTPHLRRLEEMYDNLMVAVPDFLVPLYRENRVLPRFIPLSEAQNFLQQDDVLQILNLSFPLLPHLKIEPHQFYLNGEHFRKPQHVSKSYAEALNDWFPDFPTDHEAEPFLNIDPSEEVYDFFGVQPFRYLTVHSGSDFAPKNWPAANFEKTVTNLLDRYPHVHCLSFVGPQDEELFRETPPPARFQTVRADLRTVTHLMMGSLFHIDNDSGIHHLAGAADIPSITVFGASGPGTWSSLTKQNFIHWGGLSCVTPCEGTRMTECNDRVCVTSVRVEHVCSSADTIMSAYRN